MPSECAALGLSAEGPLYSAGAATANEKIWRDFISLAGWQPPSSDISSFPEIKNHRAGGVMRNELFIERYANERHQAHLSEAALDRVARTARAPAQPGLRLVRSGVASLQRLIAALVVLTRQRLASPHRGRARTRRLADGG